MRQQQVRRRRAAPGATDLPPDESPPESPARAPEATTRVLQKIDEVLTDR